MKIQVTSIPVKNQDDALAFYTEKLGFVKKHDVDLGNGDRWLTVVPKDGKNGTELLLEPSPESFEPAKVYQKALLDGGIPYTQFNVKNIEKEYKKLRDAGVEFTKKPSDNGTAKIAVFNDECGNLIQLVEPKE